MSDLLDLLRDRPVPLLDKTRHRYYHNMPNWGPGYNKTPYESTLTATDDWGAVLDYLQSFRYSKNSYIAYSAAIEKFLLWLLVEKKKTISDLKYTDFHDYFEFLKSPSPVSYWVGPMSKKTGKNGQLNELWKPFIGVFEDGFDSTTASASELEKNIISYGLTDKAVRYHRTVLSAFFRFLFEKGHIKAIPVAPFRKQRGYQQRQIESILDRILPPGSFEDMIDYLDRQERECTPYTSEHFTIIRNRFILKMFYSTGLRLSELSAALFRDIKARPGGFYELMVDGKGERLREVLLLKDSVDAVKEFRGYFLGENLFVTKSVKRYSYYEGLMPSLRDPIELPLIPQNNLIKPVSDRRIDQLIKPVLRAVGDIYLEKAACFNPRSDDSINLNNKAGRMYKASAHWFRHTHATNFAQDNKDNIKAIMDRLGHSDPKVTMQYIHVVKKYF